MDKLNTAREYADKVWAWEKRDAISPAIKAGNTIYVAGQIAINSEGNVVGNGDLAAQADQCFRNIQDVLSRLGANMEHVVKMTTYFVGDLNEEVVRDYWHVRQKYFGDVGPASTGVRVTGLIYPECLVEVEAIAVMDC